MLAAVSAALAGCNVGEASSEPGHGPPLHVVATYPTAGAGTECDATAPDDCGVPRDAALELRFDRYLLPSTAVRQSVLLYAGFEENSVFLEPEYDVVERVVRYRLPAGVLLEPDLLYSVKISPPDPEDIGSFGFRAYDGARLEEGRVPLEFSFLTARREPDRAPPIDGSSPTCTDILSLFAQSGCSTSKCHGGEDPALGLRLDTAAGFSAALRRVAHETDVGPEGAQALVDPPRFGVGMPIVDPGNPANSYLFYKLLVNPKSYGSTESCVTRYEVLLPRGQCLPPRADERERLRNGFVLMDPMPPPPSALPSLDALRAIQAFITAGASCEP